MKDRIHDIVATVLADRGAREVAFTVEYPADIAHGDYAVNAAMVAAKTLGGKPREIAEKLSVALREALGADASSIEVAGPGFVNITLSQGALLGELEEALAAGTAWGQGTAKKDTRVLIEYSNPNAFKEMHIGHLVGTIIGEALARLIENVGAVVARDTFGGDIGPNVAKALWGLRHANGIEPTSAKEIGNAYVHGARAYEESEKAKEEIDALNKAIYAGDDKELMDLWRKGRAVSVEEFRRLWQLLGTRFDFEFFDSDTTEIGMRTVQDGLAKGIFEKSDGAVIYNGEGKGVHTMVFITSHGTPTYEAKDIGLAFLKEERWPSDKVIIVSGTEQIGRFKTVLAALRELAPLVAAKTTHVPNGFLKLSSGKMSSRTGTVITASDLIQNVIARVREKNDDPVVAGQVAVGAIKYMVLRQSPGADIVFDSEQSLSLEGDSGPYLQYALVRARSVLRAVEEAGGTRDDAALTQDAPAQPYEITRLITRFPDVAARAEALLAPNILTTYLTELAGAWNSFYAKERIVGGTYEAHKLSLARAFAATMTNGLTLLGIPTPEKM
ncbi:MAG: arginine--tRNA ligase [Parcubacteria group bacterium 21-54-25]|nr:MAG: arginine--tRNA ligase [Parcubacteria group bacterium 21-54-25]HQU07521.1 arginine--tRNA ligase [Candidatus Paceibacterota bacterium]